MTVRLHAIVLCLDDPEFLGAAIRSVYEHVDGITVGTTYDRDWQGRPVPPSGAVREVLSRADDPDRKVDLVVLHETNEARMRNRLMDLADPSPRSRRVKAQHAVDADPPAIDYFLVLDADEVWDGRDLERLRRHVARRRLPFYRVAAQPYFKSWRWRIDRLEWSVCLVRADRRSGELRNPRRSVTRLALAKLIRPVAPAAADRVLQFEDVPPEVARFHHGSYVGPRARIERKLVSFGHSHELRPDWLTAVYDCWDPDRSHDFHPAWPRLYPSASAAADEELPAAVLEHRWPAGYLG